MYFSYNSFINNEITVILVLLTSVLFSLYIYKLFKTKLYRYLNLIPVLVFLLLIFLILDFSVFVPKSEFIYPNIPLIIDSSESMIYKDSFNLSGFYDYVNKYYIGSELTRDNIRFNRTDIANIKDIFSFENELYFNNVFLFSDGNFHYSDLESVARRFNNSDKKIYTVIDNKSDELINIGLSDVRMFDYFISDTENSIEVLFNYNYDFESLDLSFYENRNLLKSYNITQDYLQKNNNRFIFDFVPSNLGKNFYEISIENVADSIPYNLSYEFIKEVVTAFNNVYLIVGNPYYDYRFFKSVLNNMDSIRFNECFKFARQSINENIIQNTNLLVLYNVNGGMFDANEVSILKNYFQNHNSSIIFIGQDSDIDFINKITGDNIFSDYSQKLYVTGNIMPVFDENQPFFPKHFLSVNYPPLEGYKNIILSDDFYNFITVKDKDVPIAAFSSKNNMFLFNAKGFYKWHLGLVPLNEHFYIKEFYKNSVSTLLAEKKETYDFDVKFSSNNINIGQNLHINITSHNKDINSINLQIFHNDNSIISKVLPIENSTAYYTNSFHEYGPYKAVFSADNITIEKHFVVIKDLIELNQINNNLAVLNRLSEMTNASSILLEDLDDMLKTDLIKLEKESVSVYKIRSNYTVLTIILLLLSVLWFLEKKIL